MPKKKEIKLPFNFLRGELCREATANNYNQSKNMDRKRGRERKNKKRTAQLTPEHHVWIKEHARIAERNAAIAIHPLNAIKQHKSVR